MSKSNIQIEVDVSGTCVTRNGVCAVSVMRAKEKTSSLVEIGFVSRRLKRSLHAGAIIEMEQLDKFCELWLKARGLKSSSLNDHGIDEVIEQIRAAEHKALTLRARLVDLRLSRSTH